MVASHLYNEIVYRPKIPYSINTFIYEYDISKANISALLDGGYISQEKYNELYHLDRDARQITIGMMIRDNREIGKAIKNGIRSAKKMLFESNIIKDWEVLSIKNDAVFVLGRQLQYTSFGLYKFNCKNVYTIFMQLDDLEIYYYDKFINGNLDVNIDVKGINNDILPIHENGLLQFICTVCSSLQRQTIQSTISFVMDFYEKFINYKLPIEYYREFNSISKYVIRSKRDIFYINNLQYKDLHYVDINRNLSIIRSVVQIVSSLM